jgi:argininosuccinate lyase
MNKLWQNKTTDNAIHAAIIDQFTAGQDKILDLQLAKFDVLGSLAHAQMLFHVGLLNKEEWNQIKNELDSLLTDIKEGRFEIEEGVEDVHSQIELQLTKKIGEAGKKIHTGRSRNDQVLLDIKLFLRSEVKEITGKMGKLFNELIELSDQHKDVLFPGYTHFQVAMPSSFGLWFAAYAEALTDDVEYLAGAYQLCNKNPLGSGAGYGSPFPLDREMTTNLLGFESMNYNVVYAQMTRGKTEKIIASAIANLAGTLSKLSYDVCLYMSQNFDFISFPDSLTTGSSIMPHKKNPDVFELIRAKCNRLQALPNELTLLVNNLPSGYHRDMQLTKEALFPALTTIKDCLDMLCFMLPNIIVKKNILEDKKYDHLFSVEEVNREVLNGSSFRDAYQLIAKKINKGEFNPVKQLNHTITGGIGNLCHSEITERFNKVAKKILG